MLKRACGVLGALVIAVTMATPARAQTGSQAGTDTTPPTAPPPAAAWIVVNADSGKVLAAFNDRQPRYVASLTKVLTAYTVLEHVRPGARVRISSRAAARPAMRIGLGQGQRWRVSHLLHSMLIVSANDAAYALAEASAGSVERFARQMQRTARRLGARDGTFFDPAGLDGAEGYRGGTTASARDMAVVARNALSVPTIRKIASKPTYAFTGGDGKPHHLTNHNRLLELYPGATGLKTGYTRAAGRTLIATAQRDGRELIAVVLDAPDSYGAASALLSRSFDAGPHAKGVGETLPDLAPRPVTSPAQPAAAAAAAQADEQGGSGGGFAPWRILQRPLAVVFILLFVLVQLRRRAVKRRRARRLARRRAYLEARRRGMLEVVDVDGFGMYREAEHARNRHVNVLDAGFVPTGVDRWAHPEDAERAWG